MALRSLRWSALDYACEGDDEWTLNSEHVRGEGRWWFVDRCPAWARELAELECIDLAHRSKRVVKQRVDRLRRFRAQRAERAS